MGEIYLLIGILENGFKTLPTMKQNELTLKKSALLPSVGTTYAINNEINVYTTYLEGYQPQSKLLV
jgi:iron complex outermembrane receptor protein